MSESTALDPRATAMLDWWFGELGTAGEVASSHQQRWWSSSAEQDAELRSRFGEAWEAAGRGELDGWAETPRGRLALILLLDQMSRNLCRGEAGAFANDARAVKLSYAGIEAGHDTALTHFERVFFYMPLMHAEDLICQQRCVELIKTLTEICPEDARPVFAQNLDYAYQHLELIERFGRFPHRNPILGRTPTPEESRYLAEGGTTFGQDSK